MSNLSVSALIAASIKAEILPATVAAKVQGEAIAMDVAAFHPATIAAIFTYGARRWMQDHVNAAANNFKQAEQDALAKGETFNGGKPFDVQACINARLAQAVSGELTVRTANAEIFTAMDDAIYDVAVSVKGESGWKELATVWAAAKGLSTTERKRAILDCVAALDESRRAKLSRAAQIRVDAMNALKGIDL